MKKIKPGQTIGIIGAGQLGKMLAMSAQEQGYIVAMYDPNEGACGFSVADHYTVGAFDDREKLLNFVKNVDVVTYEFENVNGSLLEEIEKMSYLPQKAEFLQTIQDRLTEKSWLTSAKVPVVDYQAINNKEDLKRAAKDLGYPLVLKTTRLGYDGKGQFIIKKQADIETSVAEKIIKQGAVAEAYCPFTYEASVIVARDLYGNIETFPVAQNVHCSGILFSSQAPLADECVSQKIEQVAQKIAEKSQLVGVCGVEFFVKSSDEIYVNELAPRPHNSGHYTIEACSVSQYDQHIYAVTGQPLAPIRLLSPALMINILGQHLKDTEKVREQFPKAFVHNYRKKEARSGRKMGHWTLLEEAPKTIDNVLATDFLVSWRQKF